MKRLYENLSTEELLRKRALGEEYLTPEALAIVEDILISRGGDNLKIEEIAAIKVELEETKSTRIKNIIIAAISIFLAMIISELISQQNKHNLNHGGIDGKIAFIVLGISMIALWILFKKENKEGCRINVIPKDDDNNLLSELVRCSIDGDVKSLKYILNKNIDINSRNEKGFTALMYASSNGKSEVIRILLSHGADKNIKTTKGNTALSFAKKNKHIESQNLLS
jgi:ankyrin repeat protein